MKNKGALTKSFFHAKWILAVKEGDGGGGWGVIKSVKKGKFVRKIFFADIF